MFNRFYRRGIGILATLCLTLVTGCNDALMQDLLNPNFLSGMGNTTAALPNPESSVVVMLVNQTPYPVVFDISTTDQAANVSPQAFTFGGDSVWTIAYECGLTQIAINDGTVFTPDGDESASFPSGPLDEGTEFVCGAVIKIFMYPAIDASGNFIYELSTETTLE